MKKILLSTGGGDCPGLNAVIRGVVKAAEQAGGWEVWGSIEAFNGILNDPPKIVLLDHHRVAGIHVRGGTIIRTTNKGNPLAFPMKQPDGSILTVDRSQELIDKIRAHGFDAVINIGGDGSQRISQALFEKGLRIVGVPKTIDNDLMATNRTFGFATAVQIATDCFDKLVTTAESHRRVMVMEVMGRDAGWIALHTAIAGGAEICLIPEIPYHLDVIMQRIDERLKDEDSGFLNIVIAEGAKPVGGEVVGTKAIEVGDQHLKLGGVGNFLRMQLEENGCQAQIRATILGHIQRGGTPTAYDRILATAMGVRAFELVNEGDFGHMVSLQNDHIVSVTLEEAVKEKKLIIPQKEELVRIARSTGISFGD